MSLEKVDIYPFKHIHYKSKKTNQKTKQEKYEQAVRDVSYMYHGFHN